VVYHQRGGRRIQAFGGGGGSGLNILSKVSQMNSTLPTAADAGKFETTGQTGGGALPEIDKTATFLLALNNASTGISEWRQMQIFGLEDDGEFVKADEDDLQKGYGLITSTLSLPSGGYSLVWTFGKLGGEGVPIPEPPEDWAFLYLQNDFSMNSATNEWEIVGQHWENNSLAIIEHKEDNDYKTFEKISKYTNEQLNLYSIYISDILNLYTEKKTTWEAGSYDYQNKTTLSLKAGYKTAYDEYLEDTGLYLERRKLKLISNYTDFNDRNNIIKSGLEIKNNDSGNSVYHVKLYYTENTDDDTITFDYISYLQLKKYDIQLYYEDKINDNTSYISIDGTSINFNTKNVNATGSFKAELTASDYIQLYDDAGTKKIKLITDGEIMLNSADLYLGGETTNLIAFDGGTARTGLTGAVTVVTDIATDANGAVTSVTKKTLNFAKGIFFNLT